MQNTTTSNNSPDKLIEDFFIAGMSQELLMCCFKNKKVTGVHPEIMFSLYSDVEDIQKFAQFIFPHKVHLTPWPEPPMFHTFEITDENGNQSFFHCLKFHEELNEYQIAENFDYEGSLQQLRNKRIKHMMLKRHKKHKKCKYSEQQNLEDLIDFEVIQQRFAEDKIIHRNKNLRESSKNDDRSHSGKKPKRKLSQDMLQSKINWKNHEREKKMFHPKEKKLNAKSKKMDTHMTMSNLQQHEPVIPEQEIEENMEILENICKNRQILVENTESRSSNKFGDIGQIMS